MASTNPITTQQNPPDGTSGTTGSTNSTNSAADPNELTGDDFITLLTAQLQAQDPLDPIDPTTFVTQLVQFNQLQQLIDINGALTPPTSTAATSGNAPSSAIQTNGTPSKSSSGFPQN